MANRINVNLDTNKNIYDIFECKQNDDLLLEANIFENGIMKDITNATVTINCTKADGTFVIQNTDITKEKGKVIANLKRDFTRVGGLDKLEIVLTENGKQNTTFDFNILVKNSVISGAVESPNTVTILEELGNKIVEAGQVKAETEALIQNGGAATTGDIAKVNSSLADIESYQTMQSLKLIEFYKSLMENVPVTITCRGDSITYGQDTTSVDKRTADATPTTNGTNHTFTRASKTYPERLQEILNAQYGQQVTVKNWGYCGDGTKQGLIHYPSASGSNLCIIMYGTNNATLNTLEDYNDVSSFIRNYEKMIQLELKNNTPLIIMKPHKTKYPDAKTDRFTKSLEELANKYGIPVIELQKYMANYKQDIYSDGIHYNSNGYKLIASKVATFTMSGFNKTQVQNGTVLLTRKTIDSCITDGSYDSISYVTTPKEMHTTNGIGVYMGSGKSITYYFETLEDDLFVIPNFVSFGGNANVTYELDYLETLPEKSIGALTPNSTILNTETKVIVHSLANRYVNDGIIPKLKCYVPVKGLHSIKISVSDFPIYFEGLKFVSYAELYKYNNRPIGYYDGKIYDSYSSTPNSVSETRIREESLRDVFNSTSISGDYFQAVPMKLTLVSSDRNIIEYGFLQIATGERQSAGGGMRFLGELKRTDIVASATNFRTVTNISFDNVTREYVITWGDSINALGKFIITPM